MNDTAQTIRSIRSLRNEAAAHGDHEQFEICDRALAGDASAVRECARVIADAAAQEPALTADYSHDSWRVEDPDGGVWYPDETAAEEIASADDPAARAVHICRTQPMRGEWSQ